MDFLAGTLPGWITAGGMTTIAGVLAWYLLGRGKLANEAKKIATDDAADIRDHYAEEVRQLRAAMEAQSTRHRGELEAADNRHKEAIRDAEQAHRDCEAARDELREKVSALKDQVAGLVRLLLQNSASGVLNLDPRLVSKDVLEAAQRVEQLFAPKVDPAPGGDEAEAS